MEVRATMSMFFVVQNVMGHGCLVVERVSVLLNESRK